MAGNRKSATVDLVRLAMTAGRRAPGRRDAVRLRLLAAGELTTSVVPLSNQTRIGDSLVYNVWREGHALGNTGSAEEPFAEVETPQSPPSPQPTSLFRRARCAIRAVDGNHRRRCASRQAGVAGNVFGAASSAQAGCRSLRRARRSPTSG